MDPAAAATPAWPPPEFGPPKPDGTWRSPGYRSSWIRGRVLLGFLVVTVAANVIGVIQGLAGFGVLDGVIAGTITGAEASGYDSLVAITGLTQATLYVATGLALFAWLSRVVENIPPLTGYTTHRSPREAIGWWFVPLANYVVPFLVVRDAMVRLRTSFARGAEQLIVPWWITYVLMNVGSFLTLQAGIRLATLDSIRALLTVRVADDVVWVAGAALLFLIVREMELRSRRRATALGLGRSGMATWPAASYPQPDPEPFERVDVSANGPAEPPPPPA